MNSSEIIAVITYDFPHRKTQDVVFGLKSKGYQNVHLLALPFIQRESPFKPIYSHRPSKCYNVYPKELAQNFNYSFQKIQKENLDRIFTEMNPDFILIAGAGLLPAEVVLNHRIINSHPAYLPEVRGLDALKWAILQQKTIGVTSHFVNENADAGFMIDRKNVEVYKNDTFHSLAYRQYSIEIEMLIESIEIIKSKTDFPALAETGEVNRRMPKSKEKLLLKSFESYQSIFAVDED